jgi:hypothetical protein
MTKDLRRGIGDSAVVSAFIPYVSSVISKLSSSSSVTNGAVLQKYSNEFSSMAADVVASLKDGYQLSDIYVFSKLVPEIMAMAKDISGMTGEDKRGFVVDAVWVIYHSVDTGPDGSQNRFKIPFLSLLSYIGIKSSEEQVERFILKLITESAIDAAYSYLKEKGKV